MYNFGLYHPRKWLRPILGATIVLTVAIAAWKKTKKLPVRLIALLAGATSVGFAADAASKLLRPPPWQVDGEQIDNLMKYVSFDQGNRILDMGCGTGRSLVGLAPHLPSSCSIAGLDSFGTEVIFGNAPTRTRSNTRRAGLEASIVVGDAAQSPFVDGSHDVVIISQVLHDLPTEEASQILEECLRVCATDGTLGLIELPLVNDKVSVPAEYWAAVVRESGFDVETVEYYPWKESQRYVVLTATPE